ncbi:MAG: oligopeptide transporter, OPT family [Bryobacterales bacterium]|jgi:putative OPT family oligopeptide transporter|nr:oligopeptide transporter, OPT family [Bryobacterales bacterium]
MSKTPFQPYVPASARLPEFTLRAVVLGVVISVVLGAANAYLGLKAGMTVAATYPAAVLAMALLRLRKASILEENIARSAGSAGESVAAGAIFTIPAFVLAGVWPSFSGADAYWQSTGFMVLGGVIGILFIVLLRKILVEDPELPFPESVAAAEIHKAGQGGGGAARLLFSAMGLGAAIFALGSFKLFAIGKEFLVSLGTLGGGIRLGNATGGTPLPVGGFTAVTTPSVSPAYLGVGFVIGPELAALNFSGGVLAWGLMVPLLTYILGPQLQQYVPANDPDGGWTAIAFALWLNIVRPIAVGGMLVGAAYTLFRMRHSLLAGISRAVGDLKAGASQRSVTANRLDHDIHSRWIFGGLGVALLVMIALYVFLSESALGGTLTAIIMLIVGFFFAAVSGNLVGLIGSSNNPVSGLTLSTVLIAALLMVVVGVSGSDGVAATLGVAAVICVSSAVAGEMLQDLKVGHILGATPSRMQMGDMLATVVSALVMYFPLLVLHESNIKAGGIGFGDRALPAPQAGLMASLAQGIVGGEMAWPLVIFGMLMGLALILIRMRSPMLFAVGMYLPLETTFTIFVGGLIRWAMDSIARRRQLNAAQTARVENAGVLMASGLIAGEALTALGVATWVFFAPEGAGLPSFFANPSIVAGMLVLLVLATLMVRIPLARAGNPEDPAPPQAMV